MQTSHAWHYIVLLLNLQLLQFLFKYFISVFFFSFYFIILFRSPQTPDCKVSKKLEQSETPRSSKKTPQKSKKQNATPRSSKKKTPQKGTPRKRHRENSPQTVEQSLNRNSKKVRKRLSSGPINFLFTFSDSTIM